MSGREQRASDALIARLIEAIYRAFDGVERPTHIEACEHCWSLDELQRSLEIPVRQLSASFVSRFFWRALTTAGDLTSFRYFFPRMIEYLLLEGFENPEMIAIKLEAAGWGSWSTRERALVLELLEACFHKSLEPTADGDSEPAFDGLSVEEWICALSICCADISGYLAELDLPEHRTKRGRLLSVIRENHRASGRLLENYWLSDDDARLVNLPKNRELFLSWLGSRGLPREPGST